MQQAAPMAVCHRLPSTDHDACDWRAYTHRSKVLKRVRT